MNSLEAFKKLKQCCEEYHMKYSSEGLKTVDGYNIDDIEKALRALEFIKENSFFYAYNLGDDYFYQLNGKHCKIDKETCELLKEVFLDYDN